MRMIGQIAAGTIQYLPPPTTPAASETSSAPAMMKYGSRSTPPLLPVAAGVTCRATVARRGHVLERTLTSPRAARPRRPRRAGGRPGGARRRTARAAAVAEPVRVGDEGPDRPGAPQVARGPEPVPGGEREPPGHGRHGAGREAAAVLHQGVPDAVRGGRHGRRRRRLLRPLKGGGARVRRPSRG